MALDIFDTYTMLEAIGIIPRPKTFFIDMFFGNRRKTNATKSVVVDVFKGGRRIAPFVNPRHAGKPVAGRGYQVKEYTPPYIKPFRPTTADDLLRRTPGEVLFSGSKTPDQRAAEKLGEDFADLDDLITRREEWMAACALLDGTVVCVGEGVDDQVDFERDAANTVDLTGADLWSAFDTSTPYDDLKAWKRQVTQTSLLSPNVCVLGLEAADVFMDHPQILKKLDNRRVDLGIIKPEELSEGVNYLGFLRELGLDLYTYEEIYQDDNGDNQPLMPTTKVLLGSSRARADIQYGAIQDLKAILGGPTTFETTRFPKTWVEDNPSARFVMLQAAPLPIPHDVDAFLCAEVL